MLNSISLLGTNSSKLFSNMCESSQTTRAFPMLEADLESDLFTTCVKYPMHPLLNILLALTLLIIMLSSRPLLNNIPNLKYLKHP